jgi:pimeloyl-ACP methyl ester carboxylesterase
VLARLDSKPALVPAKHPVTGKPTAVRITSADVKANLVSWGAYGLSDTEGVTRWPALVSALDAGDYRPILQSVIGNRLGLYSDSDASGNIVPAIFMPIDCSYGITDARRARILAAPEQRILGDINARYFNGCHVWSVRDAGKDIRDNFHTDVPVLMVQGEFDTATPLENAEHMQKLMPNSRLMVVQRGTHNVEWEVAEAHPDVWARVIGFIRDGNMPDIPSYLEMPPPPYVRP